jgi:LysM repeat protein
MVGKRLICLGLLVGLLLTMLPGAILAQGASVSVQPGSQSIAVNANTTVNVRIEGVTDLYGAEVHVSFSPGVVQVVDADGNAGNGVQVTAGDLFAGKNAFSALNAANNSTGVIDYAISLLGEPAGVTGAGNLLSITFRGAGQGLSAVAFVSVMLASRTGGQITATTANGAITVTGAASTPTNTTVPPTATTPAGATATATTPAGATNTPTRTATTVPGSNCTYVVQWGDTLYSIARRYGTTTTVLQSMNGLANPNYIRAGQVLYVPCSGGSGTPTATATSIPSGGCAAYHVVASGDTLSSIARRYGVTLSAILAVNYIPNPNYIWVGQRICIPGSGVPVPTATPKPGGCRAFYTVARGDTLLAIAARYGTTYWAIAIANNIANPNLIYPGCVLCIP